VVSAHRPRPALCRSIGLDSIISDHHQQPKGITLCAGGDQSKQAGDRYPEKDLAGVGVAYSLPRHWLSKCEKSGPNFQLEDVLDLVALGTVADLVPLVGENRLLVRKGLQKIRETKRQGLFSLAAVSDLVLARTTAISIGFILGPRLNAAGRLESALAAYDLLTTTDLKQAGELSQQLNNQNRLRRNSLVRSSMKPRQLFRQMTPTPRCYSRYPRNSIQA